SQLPDDLAPRPGRHNLFPRTSFSAWRLRAWSATIRFSWRFSSSSCLSRFASETSMPPYFRFQAYRVSRLMPSRRHSSRTFAPASASLTAATFCSSVNLLLRMTPPRSVRRSQIISGSGFGGQLTRRYATLALVGPPAASASGGLLRFPGRLRSPWPATLQSVQACRPCFGLAASLTHEPRRPLAQVQRISHEPGERSIDVQVVPV